MKGERVKMNDLISRRSAIDALKQLRKNISGDYTELDPLVMAGCGYIGDCIGEIECLPSAQPDNRLERIADIVEGTIDHLDRDDAMDMLYQIKEVLK